MKVLVTGATGFLGGWLVERLLDEGHEVRVIQRKKTQIEGAKGFVELKNLDVVPGDVTDSQSLASACAGMDTVFHLAGLIAYTRSERAAMERVNVQGTANVVAACKKAGVRRLVHLSSVVAVGASFDGKAPLNENSPYNVHHLDLGYFETKHEAEKIVKSACSDGSIDAVMINPSTIYGRGDAKKGSRGTQVKVAQGRFPFYPPGGVSVVAVEDVIEAILAAWMKGRNGERYIISGENLLIKDVFDLIAQEAGVKPPWLALPRPAIFAIGQIGEWLETFGKKGPINLENAWTSVLYHWFDASKAKQEFGLKFKPASSAIAESVRWMRDNKLI